MNHIQYTEYFRPERIVTTTENSTPFEKTAMAVVLHGQFSAPRYQYFSIQITIRKR